MFGAAVLQGFFSHWYPPKSSKYKKVNLGVSRTIYINVDSPNLTAISVSKCSLGGWYLTFVGSTFFCNFFSSGGCSRKSHQITEEEWMSSSLFFHQTKSWIDFSLPTLKRLIRWSDQHLLVLIVWCVSQQYLPTGYTKCDLTAKGKGWETTTSSPFPSTFCFFFICHTCVIK